MSKTKTKPSLKKRVRRLEKQVRKIGARIVTETRTTQWGDTPSAERAAAAGGNAD